MINLKFRFDLISDNLHCVWENVDLGSDICD